MPSGQRHSLADVMAVLGGKTNKKKSTEPKAKKESQQSPRKTRYEAYIGKHNLLTFAELPLDEEQQKSRQQMIESKHSIPHAFATRDVDIHEVSLILI